MKVLTQLQGLTPRPGLPRLSQVSALLAELSAMRAADPGAKAVVFSSWGRWATFSLGLPLSRCRSRLH